VTCELTFVLMLPFTLAWRAWRSGRWTSAGAWLGACASFAVPLARRALAGVAAVMEGAGRVPGGRRSAGAAGALVFGVESYQQDRHARTRGLVVAR
jgi:hypothetical protein